MIKNITYLTLLIILLFSSKTVKAEGALALQHMGPTGINGYISSSRSFIVKNVEKGSPADGKLWPGDVVVGAGRMPFLKRVRFELGAAIAEAMTSKKQGRLVLMVRRKAGGKKVSRVTLQLKVVGADTFSKTAPYKCAKTDALIKFTADHLITNKWRGKYSFGSLKIGLLGLLATGEEKYIKFVGDRLRESKWAQGNKDPNSLVGNMSMYTSWRWSYNLLILTEYYLLTKEKFVLPSIRMYAEGIAAGQDAAGLWGHRMHDVGTGRAFGYGIMNQTSVVAYMALGLARKCGVDSERITQAHRRTTNHYKKFIGKGALGYGNSGPSSKGYNNNGTTGSLAVAFAIANEIEGARFFSRMSLASYNDMETGHATHFFNLMWTAVGANVSGPEGAGLFFQKMGYFYSMKIDWRGGYVYEQKDGEELGNTGAYLLNLCTGRNAIHITGKAFDKAIKLNSKEVAESMGVHVFRNSLNKMGIDELFEVYDTHWSPLIRRLAAWKLLKFKRVDLLAKINERRKKIPNTLIGLGRFWDSNPEELDKVEKILLDTSAPIDARAGAARTLGGAAYARYIEPEEKFGKKEFYGDKNLHLPAVKYFSSLVKVVADDEKNDPWGTLDAAAGSAMARLGDPFKNKLIKDKKLFYKAINKLLVYKHSTGVRSAALGMLKNGMPIEDFHYVAENVVIATKGTDRSFTVYRGGNPTGNGIKLLNRLNVQEVVEICLQSFSTATRSKEIAARLELLFSLGPIAKPYLPRLKKMLEENDSKTPKDDEAKGFENNKDLELDEDVVMAFIDEIENAPDSKRKMISLKEAIEIGKKK